jgi:hypothetical protein
MKTFDWIVVAAVWSLPFVLVWIRHRQVQRRRREWQS